MAEPAQESSVAQSYCREVAFDWEKLGGRAVVARGSFVITGSVAGQA